jgi:threonyl-tRNA synthetase
VLAVIGAKEAEARGASLRSRADGDLGLVAAEALLAAAAAANSQRAASLGLEPVGSVAA